jgi:hypothetical protein
MKLKRSRLKRTCHLCGATINKGDLYGSRSIRIGEKATQQEHEEAGRQGKFLIEFISVKRDICSDCCPN